MYYHSSQFCKIGTILQLLPIAKFFLNNEF